MDSLFGDDPSLGHHTHTVADLARAIGSALDAALPGEVWVQGEVRDLDRSKAGHVYFNLIDPVAHGEEPKASISVVLFRSTKEQVNRLLSRHGAGRVEDGARIRIRSEIDFYLPKGRLQLQMTGIDPEYTLGQLAADRDQLLRLLRSEDLLERNGRLLLPTLPLSIGLVTSAGSAAASDFLHELELSGIGWQVRLVDTRVQGADAPPGIARAVASAAVGCDVVVVVRGGGARTDLAAFDTEMVARAIATCPRPVLTGIGHEIDRAVADEVAHLALKTPTACATALVERVRAAMGELDRRWHGVAASARQILDAEAGRLHGAARRSVVAPRAALQIGDARLTDAARRTERAAPRQLTRAATGLDTTVERLAAVATLARDRATAGIDGRAAETATRTSRSMATASARLTDATRRLRTAGRHRTTDHERQLDALEARVSALDPARTLARGWSITRREDGSVVRSAADVDAGDEIVTTVGDGRIRGQVVGRDDPATERAEGAP